jgi:hypothetical protein
VKYFLTALTVGGSSEALVSTLKSTRRRNPTDQHQHFASRENHKSFERLLGLEEASFL